MPDTFTQNKDDMVRPYVCFENYSTHKITLTPFQPNVPFLCPGKTTETFGFLTFSGGKVMEHWVEID